MAGAARCGERRASAGHAGGAPWRARATRAPAPLPPFGSSLQHLAYWTRYGVDCQQSTKTGADAIRRARASHRRRRETNRTLGNSHEPPSRDPILLTPGPLTTSLPTKAAMLRDWGSWDSSFNAVTADVRRKLARHHPRPRHARLRADAGQRHVFHRGGRQHAGAARRPRAGADQRRVRHAPREAHRG